jgi:dienelactone hydrolase
MSGVDNAEAEKIEEYKMLPYVPTSLGLVSSLSVLFSIVLPQNTNAETARLEIYAIETLTLTDRQFLLGAKDSKPARIGAELRFPPETARVPAVVLIHGSGGVGANVHAWARELNAMGIAVLILDTFTGRRIAQTIADQSQLSSFSMIVDAYKGLELLSHHPGIDSTRIAVMGFSKGGFAALYSSMKRFQRLWGTPGIEFAAYISFYTRCDAPLLDDEIVSDRPIRVFHGSADDYVPVEPTRRYVDRLKRAGKDVQLTVYEGARHAFDNPLYPSVLSLPDAVLTNSCRREEKQPGNIVNLDTGKTFTWKDACVTRGATVGFDPHAREQAMSAVSDFLRAQWNLTSYNS